MGTSYLDHPMQLYSSSSEIFNLGDNCVRILDDSWSFVHVCQNKADKNLWDNTLAMENQSTDNLKWTENSMVKKANKKNSNQ